MSQQQIVSGLTRFVMSQPDFDVGQRVRVRRGNYRGCSGRITLCSWEPEYNGWGYTVSVDGQEVGPLSRHDICL
jgi:hypothetical protein